MATEARKAEERKRPINRLQSMYALRSLVDERYQETQEAQKEGKPIAWCMQEAFASEFLSAIGIESVYPENYGTVCAADGIAQAFLERSEAEGFPTHMCGYAQNCIGYTARMMKDLGGQIPPEAPKGGMPKPMLLVGAAPSCDTRSKFFQALGRYLDTALWIMQGPRSVGREGLIEGAYERDVNFMVKELREFAAFLERLVGKKMDWDKFQEDLDSTMEMSKMWYEITDVLLRTRPFPMNSRDHYSAMSGSYFRAGDPKAVIELYRKMYDEVKYRVDNKIAGINYPEKYRLLFDGLAPWHTLGIFDRLAERGWNFVHEMYHPPRPIDLSMVSDPVERLVRYRVRSIESEIDSEFKPEEAAKIKEEIKQIGYSNKLAAAVAKNYQLDGAFLHTNLTCRIQSTGPIFRGQQFMEGWQVPSLIIQSDMVNKKLFDLEDTMRKAEAFEETMDHYKKVRQEAGLEW